MKRAATDSIVNILRRLFGLLLLALCCADIQAQDTAEQPMTMRRVAVLFPQLQAPYVQIFKSIIDSINGAHQGPLAKIELSDSTSPEGLAQALAREQSDAIIALGNRSVEILLQTDRDLKHAVAGAVLMEQGDDKQLSAISVAPDPHHLFSHLLRLTPSVKTIHVIYQRGQERQIIEEAVIAAEKLNVTLHGIETDSVQELADAYRKFLKKQNSRTEALWIPHTGQSLDQAIMSRVLRDAWNRSLIVFSSNLADVRKGALFALYPDNQALGRSLVSLLHQRLDNPQEERSVTLSRDLLSAINIRTANHLGIYLNANELSNYRLVYPEGK